MYSFCEFPFKVGKVNDVVSHIYRRISISLFINVYSCLYHNWFELFKIDTAVFKRIVRKTIENSPIGLSHFSCIYLTIMFRIKIDTFFTLQIFFLTMV